MITHTADNFYKYYADSISILLIDKKATISGAVMQQFNFRLPNKLEELHKKLIDTKVGNCYKVDDYIFMIVKDSYRNKYNEATFATIWSGILTSLIAATKVIHIDIEDYPWVENILKQYDDDRLNIILHNHCEW